MKEELTIEEVLAKFREFCRAEISACGSPDETCVDCIFYKKYVELLKAR